MMEGPTPLHVLEPQHRITAAELAGRLQQLRADGSPFVLLDVRPAVHFAASRLQGAQSFPIEGLKWREGELLSAANAAGTAAAKFVLCRRGNDSQLAVQALLQLGVTNVVDVEGGMTAWSRDVDATVPVL